MFTRISFFGFFSCCVGLFGGQAQTPSAKDEAQRVVEDASKIKVEKRLNESLPTIWIIGDSTVRVNTEGQRGWGDEMAPFFDLSKVNIVNRAIGGRSSRTFYTEGRWDLIMAEMKAGDIVLMQFGHNDGGVLNEKVLDKSTRARGTIKGTGEETEEIDNILTKKHEIVHTYGWYMRKYVQDTQSKGATPIVCSLVPRNQWEKDGKTVIRSVNSYAQWAREVAEKHKALFLDLNNLIAVRWESMGPEAVAPLFYKDHTHTSPAGAKVNAECVVEGLKALPVNPTAPFLK